GQDQLDLHAGQGGDAQGVDGAVVGHEVGGGDDQPALGQVDQGLDGVAGVGEGEGGAAGQQLHRHVLLLQRPGRGDFQFLAGFQVPVDGEHGLDVGHHRALQASDQLAVGVAGDEVGAGEVLRAEEGDVVVDDGELAVVAQVQ